VSAAWSDVPASGRRRFLASLGQNRSAISDAAIGIRALMRIGLIGYGAIGRAFCECAEGQAEVVAVLTRQPRAGLSAGVTTLEALLATKPGVVVECAGQAALRAYGPALLGAGIDVIAASVGALADTALMEALLAARSGGTRLVVPSGAVAGLDGLGAAKQVGLSSVTYRQSAPPTSWIGHPDAPAGLERPGAHLVFRGTARDAASRFPKNANVTAAIALAGIGFERTMVELYSDGSLTRNRHQIFAEGAFGQMSVDIDAEPIAPGVRSSRLVAGSLLYTALAGGLAL
jgi:aspartate dehydrogenase